MSVANVLKFYQQLMTSFISAFNFHNVGGTNCRDVCSFFWNLSENRVTRSGSNQQYVRFINVMWILIFTLKFAYLVENSNKYVSITLCPWQKSVNIVLSGQMTRSIE